MIIVCHKGSVSPEVEQAIKEFEKKYAWLSDKAYLKTPEGKKRKERFDRAWARHERAVQKIIDSRKRCSYLSFKEANERCTI